jgi:uncharacterized LabA/DUF88 family protein
MQVMNHERTVVLIDGSNFYFKLKDLGLHALDFHFSAFTKFLAGNRKVKQCTYFVGEVRTDGTAHVQKLYNNQQKLIARLKHHGVRYQFGYLLKSDGKFHEKGVDVHIAVAILVAAYENLADRIILISSDTDLIPAVAKAQEKGKIVEYVGFSHKISLAMARSCRETRTLTRDDLLPFIQKQKQPTKNVA